MKTYSVFDIAYYFVAKGADIHKKIQNLCYYAQVWSLVYSNQPIIDTNFEAWAWGPVNPELWELLKHRGYGQINKDDLGISPKEITDSYAIYILDRVWDTYGEYSGFELERLVCSEDPWLIARKDCKDAEPSSKPIDAEIMKRYYASLLIKDGVSD